MRRFYPVLFVLAFAANLAASSFLTLTAMPAGNPFGAGFAPGTVDGIPIRLMCLDYTSKTYIGDRVEVNVSLLVTGGLGLVRFETQPGNLVTYEQAALMLHQAIGASDADVVAYQYAIWKLFEPGSVNLAGVAQNYYNYYSNLTAAELNRYTYADIRIYTPIDKNDYRVDHPNIGNQEFMSGDVGEAPEPATLLLMGSALLACSFLLRKKAVR